MTATDPGAADRAAAARRLAPIPFWRKSAYGAGQMVDAFISSAINLFLFFYLTAVCGLSGSLAGSAVFVALLVDAFVDPMAGSLSDNAHFKAGRRHPFMAASLAPLILGFAFLFSLPVGAQGGIAFAFVTGLSVVVRSALSFFMVPYAALGAELTDDYVERSSVVSYRLFFGTVGAVICMALGALVFFPGEAGLSHRAAYAPFAWTCAALVLASASVAIVGTLGLRDRLHRAPPRRSAALRQLGEGVGELFRNPTFLALFGCEVIYFVALGVSNTLTFHAYSFFWRLPQNFGQWVVVAGCVGTPLGVLLNTVVSHRFEKRDTVVACILFSAAAQGALPLLKIFGVAPTGATLQVLLFGVAVAVGAVITIETIAFYSMIADSADEHEHRFGARREGLYFAGLSFAIKASSGAGSFVAGAILDLIRFPAGAAAHGGAVIEPGVLLKLGLIYGPGVACAMALSVVPILAYGLGRSRHAAILEALASRRDGGAETLGTAA